MAFTAREVIMTFRGQNYLSGAIRRIGMDVQGLSRQAQLAQQRGQLQLVGQRIAQSRNLARAELASVVAGQRNLSVQRARAQLSINESRAVSQMTNIRTRYLTVQRQQIANEERITELQRLQAQNVRYLGMMPGVTGVTPSGRLQRRGGRVIRGALVPRQEVGEALKQAQLDQKRLAETARDLQRQTETQVASMSNMSLAAQQVAAREAALVTREAQLKDAIQTRTRALAENTIAQIQNNFEAEKIEPVQRWQQRAAAIEHTGRVLQMFGLIATATMGFAAESAAKFNSQFTLAATQARPAGAPATRTVAIGRDISKQVLDMMQQFPASAEEMSNSFYEIFSGTNIQQVGQATEAVRVFNQMAVAGGADLKTMTDAGISMYNNFGGLHGEFKNMTDAANAFFATVRYGRMNAIQWAQAMPFVLSIAKEAGLTYKDVSETMALLTRQTGARYTGRDAQGLARLIQLFGRADVSAGLAAKGIDVFDKTTGRMRRPFAIIEDIHKRMNLTYKQALNFFKEISANAGTGRGGTQGTVQAIRAFGFIYQNMEQAQSISKQVRGDTDEMVKSFQAMSKTGGVQWSVFLNQLRVLVYTIGNQAIPALLEFGRPIQRAVKWFNDLSDGTKHTIGYIVTFTSVLTLLGGTAAMILSGPLRILLGFMATRRLKELSQLVTDLRGQAVLQTPAEAPQIFGPSGRVLATVGASGAVAGKGFMDAERGAIQLRYALLSIIPIAIAWHKQFGQAINDLGGFNNVIGLVTIAISGFSLMRAVNTFFKLRAAAEVAGVAMSRARLALLALNGLTAVATLIYVIKHRGGSISDPFNLNKDFKDKVDAWGAKATNAISKYTGTHAIMSFFGFPGGKGHYLDTKTPAQEQAEQSDQAIKKAIADSPRYQHVIRANQQAVDKFNESLARQANIQKLERTAGIVTTKLQRGPQEWINAVLRARKEKLIDPTDIAKARHYETVVDALNRRFKDQPLLLAAINDVLQQYESNMDSATKAAQKTAQSTKVSFEQVLSGVQNMWQNLQQQNQQNFGQLFQGPYMSHLDKFQFGGLPTAEDVRKDLNSQIRQFRQFNGLIAGLARRGAPAELIKQLQAMGPQAMDQIKALASMRGPEIERYFKSFRTAQQIIHQQTMTDLNRQLSDYMKYGRNIALQIIAGLRSEDQPLEAALTNVIKRVFGKIPTQAQIDAAASASATTTTKSKPPTTAPASLPPTTQAQINARTRAQSLETTNDYTWMYAMPTNKFSPPPGKQPSARPPRRMYGGPASAGVAHIVGERGPELFTPKRHGFVTPAHATAQLKKLGFVGATAAQREKDIEFAANRIASGKHSHGFIQTLAKRTQWDPNFQEAIQERLNQKIAVAQARENSGLAATIGQAIYSATPAGAVAMIPGIVSDIRRRNYLGAGIGALGVLPIGRLGRAGSILTRGLHAEREVMNVHAQAMRLGLSDRLLERVLMRKYRFHGTDPHGGAGIQRVGKVLPTTHLVHPDDAKEYQRVADWWYSNVWSGPYNVARKAATVSEQYQGPGSVAFLRLRDMPGTEVRDIMAHRGPVPISGIVHGIGTGRSLKSVYASYLWGRAPQRLREAIPTGARLRQFRAEARAAQAADPFNIIQELRESLYGPHSIIAGNPQSIAGLIKRVLREERGSVMIPGGRSGRAGMPSVAATRGVQRLGTGQGRSILDIINQPMTEAEKEATRAKGIWYHGTSYSFSRFRMMKTAPEGLWGPGHYFTNNPRIAAGYASTYMSDELFGSVRALREMMQRNPAMELIGVKREYYSNPLENQMVSMTGMGGPQLAYMNPGHTYLRAYFAMRNMRPQVRMHRLMVNKPFVIDAVTKSGAYHMGERVGTHTEVGPVLASRADRLKILEEVEKYISERRAKGIGFKYGVSNVARRSMILNARSNRRLYDNLENLLETNYTFGKAAANRVLQKAGFDAIQHVGGQITGRAPHQVTIVFSGTQVRPHYWRGGIANQDYVGHAGEMILTLRQQRQLAGLVFGGLNMMNRPQMQQSQQQPKEEHVHYHITAPQPDQLSIKAQMRHADLARRNRYS